MTRLIDADALKEIFNVAFFEDEDDYKKSLNLIDNAPTVIPDNDIFEWCTDCKEYDQEKHCCHRWSSKIREAAEEIKQYKLDELRPQGEWVVTAEDNDGVHRICCPFCSYEKGSNNTDPIIVTFANFPKFCENCGADMRGDAE